MKKKITPFSIGLKQELYFVCKEENREYFREACLHLENFYAVKSDVYAYDSDGWSTTICEKLKNTTYVVFCLQPGAVEAAAASETDELRRVISFINQHNKEALSLIAISPYHILSVDLPKDMNMFEYLHCKELDLDEKDEEAFAHEIYRELRRTYFQSEQALLADLARNGVKDHKNIYDNLSIIATAFFVVMGVAGLFLWKPQWLTGGLSGILFTLIFILSFLAAIVLPIWLVLYTAHAAVALLRSQGILAGIVRVVIVHAIAVAAVAAVLNISDIIQWLSAIESMGDVSGDVANARGYLMIGGVTALIAVQAPRYYYLSSVLSEENMRFLTFAKRQKTALFYSLIASAVVLLIVAAVGLVIG